MTDRPSGAQARVKKRRTLRPDVSRAKVALPNGLTLGNLFFGIGAIISASRGAMDPTNLVHFDRAVLFIVLGGVCDAFDGRVARATGTGGKFGEELDSLVDAISFGLAPALIVYFSTLSHQGWGWLPVFMFSACAVMRLARFNVTQAGESKTYFQGLPSPAAGGTLATYYWFSQTAFYQNTPQVVGLPWQQIMQWLMIVLAILMISDVPYPAWPKVGIRSWKGIAGLVIVLFILFGTAYWRRAFFFPFGIGYVAWGLLRGLALGIWERRPSGDAYGSGVPRRHARPTPRGAPLVSSAADEEEEIDPDVLPDLTLDRVDDDLDFFEDEEDAPAGLPAPAVATRGDGVAPPAPTPARRKRKRRKPRGPAGGAATSSIDTAPAPGQSPRGGNAPPHAGPQSVPAPPAPDRPAPPSPSPSSPAE